LPTEKKSVVKNNLHYDTDINESSDVLNIGILKQAAYRYIKDLETLHKQKIVCVEISLDVGG